MDQQSNVKVTLVKNGVSREVTANKDETLMKVLIREGWDLNAPCGGKGLCGKCRIIATGGLSEPDPDELRHLSSQELEQGIRMACHTKVLSEATIYEYVKEEQAKILTEGAAYEVNLSPVSAKEVIFLSEATLEDQRDDFGRLSDALELEISVKTLDVAQALPDLLRENAYCLMVHHTDHEILAVSPPQNYKNYYGISIDIGTTTVVCYLLNLSTGKRVDVLSELNHQRTFGADVISRMAWCIDHEEGRQDMKKSIVTQLDAMVHELLEKNHLEAIDLTCLSIAGNTAMMHFLMGLKADHIAKTPFTPAFTGSALLEASALGFTLPDGVKAYLLPSLSGYVGADIVAGILSSRMYQSEEICLLLDIGTNGEIALGNKDRIVCCSTAAGPAFEGANIKMGMGGVKGAINKVNRQENTLSCEVISGGKPVGICGSGIVDAVSLMLSIGVIDDTGRMLDEDEFEGGPELAARLIEADGMKAFVLVKGNEADYSDAIVITQKDIREIQLAKAAIAAGINTLVKAFGVKPEAVGKVYLAGGFGSYLDKENAVGIGLIPKALKDRIVVIGNAAGSGASMALLSRECRNDLAFIKKKCEYLELSASKEFQEEMIDCIYFA